MKKIVIDLGHGGNDSGATGQSGMKESNVVLRLGKEIDKLLKEYDIKFKFTRLTDIYISLEERVKIANELNADYFISIHMNSSNDNSVRGIEVWQYDNLNESINKFSNNICLEISKELSIRNRGVKLDKELYVLRKTRMPACLIELDFISNREVGNYMDKDENIKVLSNIIVKNILKLSGIYIVDKNLYRVCIGTYKDKSNAIKQVELAKNKGFEDVYII